MKFLGIQLDTFDTFCIISIFSFQDIIWTIATGMAGNTHVTRLDLFQETDAWYSYSFATPEGNIRNHFCNKPRGLLPTGDPVARFRLVKRTEVTINLHLLTPTTVVAILGNDYLSTELVTRL